jgi:V/A-type H+-transporting ATPase subunit A
VDWTDSFSGYVATVSGWWDQHVGPGWKEKRAEALGLLAQADELSRIVNLVGPEALSPVQRWTLESSALVKDGVLQQSALDPVDSYSSPEKQYVLLDLILDIYHQGLDLLSLGVPVQELLVLPILGRVRRIKGVYSSDKVEELRAFGTQIRAEFDRVRDEYRRAEKTAV